MCNVSIVLVMMNVRRWFLVFVTNVCLLNTGVWYIMETRMFINKDILKGVTFDMFRITKSNQIKSNQIKSNQII